MVSVSKLQLKCAVVSLNSVVSAIPVKSVIAEFSFYSLMFLSSEKLVSVSAQRLSGRTVLR